MKNISKFVSKLNATQVINKKGLSSIKGGASDPPPFGVIYASDPPPFGQITLIRNTRQYTLLKNRSVRKVGQRNLTH